MVQISALVTPRRRASSGPTGALMPKAITGSVARKFNCTGARSNAALVGSRRAATEVIAGRRLSPISRAAPSPTARSRNSLPRRSEREDTKAVGDHTAVVDDESVGSPVHHRAGGRLAIDQDQVGPVTDSQAGSVLDTREAR